MATIGGKRRTKKQTRIKAQRVATMAHRLAGTTGRPKVLTGKRFQQFLKNYEDAIQEGKLHKIKEIEDLKAKWGNYFKKDGTPNLNKLRTKRKREQFNADMRAFNKKYRRWGKKAVAEIGEEQKTKTQKRIEKATETFSENQARKAVEKARENGETVGVDFEGIAKKESENYSRMLELFANDSLNKLREELNIGSPVVQALASMGLSTEAVDNYIKDFREAYKKMPQEARDLAKEDDLNSAILGLSNMHGAENLTDVLAEYIKADSEEERAIIAEAGEFHANAVKNGYTNTSFADFWDEARGTSSKKWGEFL